MMQARMPAGALFVAAIVAGTSYFVATRTGFDGADMAAWKGAGVGLLALWAARNADDADGWLLASVLALGAAGDVLLETHGLDVGAAAFLVGHLLAVALYARDRLRRGWARIAVAAVAVAAVGFALTGTAAVGLYALGLGAMAGAASLGRFGRWPAVGAWAFVASDLLIFARIGPLSGSAVPDWGVWPLYFGGQALIAGGVGAALAKERAA